MEKEVIVSASCYTQKYYINPKFDGLPREVKEILKENAIILSQKIHGVFTIGIYEDGFVYIESTGEECDYNYDEIGAGLEIKRIERESKDLFNEIEIWYKLIFTKGIENENR